jgi:hypothetical protein
MASHARVQFGEEQKSPSPRGPSSEISEGTAALSPEIFWRAFGAARPPNVRYGTVLRAALTSDTKPYQPKFLFKTFRLFVRNLLHAGTDD